VVVGILHDAYLLTCWSASIKQVWSRHLAAWETSCFFSITWCGEALYGLGGLGCRSLNSSWCFFFCQV
jgi:hypothetical protein